MTTLNHVIHIFIVALGVNLLSGCIPSIEQNTTALDPEAIEVELLSGTPSPSMKCKNLGGISGRDLEISTTQILFGTTKIETAAGVQNRIRNQAAKLGANKVTMLGEADGVAYRCP